MHPDATIRRIANRQLHLITTKQALQAGVTEAQLRRRLLRGSLRRIHRGVFLTAGDRPSLEQRALAACLASGEGAFASHLTAAKLWGFVQKEPDAIEVTVPGSRRVRIPTIRIHRSLAITASDHGVRDAVPIASPSRTLLDIAGVLDVAALERAADEAFRRPHVSPKQLLLYLSRDDVALFPGIGTLRGFARDRAENGCPESDFETLMDQLIRRYGLPKPVRQHRTHAAGRPGVGGVRFDFAYPGLRIAIEPDGRAPHWGRDRWQTDHDRHNATTLAGWEILRFTWWDVTERPLYVVLTIAEKLGIRPTRWTSPRRKATEMAVT